ncbi:hypothetical protein [Kribbella jiaozuonensis]|uniref:Resolvase-like protein n=1 Tax=Kribbella jiaozuonensis TaxID=2575441 RepID=A0A4U3LVH9_9ACTN|nr:hypothetical protein [Kribbella jiaozuonensis]TKK80121.1 hypothetical protein FDA38_17450 [Kribbella jiaozuonensis]
MHVPATPALGFVSMSFVRNTGELLAIRRQLKAFATEHRLQITKVYVEEPGPPSAAFDLLESLLESDGQPLVVPTLHHLAAIGHPLKIRDHLRRCTHEVLIATMPAERTC